MICPSCLAPSDDAAEACLTCGRALSAPTQGSVIAGRYEVLGPLGRGGMGTVYKAHDRMLDETVAIKVLRPEFADTVEMTRRFRHEIKLARKVSHRNVCRIHEYGEDGGRRYISMEYVEGADIKQLARDKGGFLGSDEAFDVAIQAADGLQAIHDVGVIHRDLKASNIMRDPSGRVRLMDFGIAKYEASDRTAGEITGAGQIMGTPEYMSPEQCLGDRIDNRSDIYALGVVVYEIFTGSVPFRGETPVATLFKHIQDPVPFEGRAAARIPLAAVAVLRKALAKNRADRFDTAGEMAGALRRAQEQGGEGLRTDEAPTQDLSAFLTPHEDGGEPRSAPAERRRSTRLNIFYNFRIRRLGTAGTVLKEERTVAENVSRGGARVFTTWSELALGDIIHLEHVDGPFKTRAEIRGSYVGTDNVCRLNLHFLDSNAPDYLVRVDEGSPRR